MDYKQELKKAKTIYNKSFVGALKDVLEKKMKRRICVRCCEPIKKSGLKDPYLCRHCEKVMIQKSKTVKTQMLNISNIFLTRQH